MSHINTPGPTVGSHPLLAAVGATSLPSHNSRLCRHAPRAQYDYPTTSSLIRTRTARLSGRINSHGLFQLLCSATASSCHLAHLIAHGLKHDWYPPFSTTPHCIDSAFLLSAHCIATLRFPPLLCVLRLARHRKHTSPSPGTGCLWRFRYSSSSLSFLSGGCTMLCIQSLIIT